MTTVIIFLILLVILLYLIHLLYKIRQSNKNQPIKPPDFQSLALEHDISLLNALNAVQSNDPVKLAQAIQKYIDNAKQWFPNALPEIKSSWVSLMQMQLSNLVDLTRAVISKNIDQQTQLVQELTDLHSQIITFVLTQSHTCKTADQLKTQDCINQTQTIDNTFGENELAIANYIQELGTNGPTGTLDDLGKQVQNQGLTLGSFLNKLIYY